MSTKQACRRTGPKKENVKRKLHRKTCSTQKVDWGFTSWKFRGPRGSLRHMGRPLEKKDRVRGCGRARTTGFSCRVYVFQKAPYIHLSLSSGTQESAGEFCKPPTLRVYSTFFGSHAFSDFCFVGFFLCFAFVCVMRGWNSVSANCIRGRIPFSNTEFSGVCLF
jgi:hypothetical protein